MASTPVVVLASVCLLLFCPAARAEGQIDFVCRAAPNCHGHVVEGPSTRGDCCLSNSGAGLSYFSSGGCTNCYSKEGFTSLGSEMYTAVPNTLQVSEMLSREKDRLVVATFDKKVKFIVNTTDHPNLMYQTSIQEVAEVILDSKLKLENIVTRNKGIHIKSVGGERLSVVISTEEFTTGDTFLVLPPVYLPDLYEYYAVSVPKVIIIDEGEVIDPTEKSAFIIVGCEDDTIVNVSVKQNISFPGIGEDIEVGIPINLVLNKRETLYISHVEDLSGSRVVANKPIAFITGHECGNLPADHSFCDQMFEQIPPTSTWGQTFFTAPLSTRKRVDHFKFIASKDNTDITGACGSVQPITVAKGMNAGDVVGIDILSTQYCQFISDKPVLLMQFSVGESVDNVTNADPFMVMVPPIKQFRNEYIFSVLQSGLDENVQYFINIVMEAKFNRNSLLINNVNITEDWTEINCVGDVRSQCAYGIQVAINASTSPYIISHKNQSARFGVTVYSFGYRFGEGYTAGVNQYPLALDRVTFDALYFEATEKDEELIVTLTLERPGNAENDVTVEVKTRELSEPNSAKAGKDFILTSKVVRFKQGEKKSEIKIPLADDDVFPEENKTFEVYLTASQGVFIYPNGYAQAVIFNDDRPLPVMNVSFASQKFITTEGDGYVELVLLKTNGAIGSVSVELSTLDGTATVENRDYQQTRSIVTFEKEVREISKLVKILDNSNLEGTKSFSVMITAISGLYPVSVINSTAIVEINDDDFAIFGFDVAKSEIKEGETLQVVVELKYGVIDKNITVHFSTESDTAKEGEDYITVNKELQFSSRMLTQTVDILITSDRVLEVSDESFIVKISNTVEYDNVLMLLPSQCTILIIDTDKATIGFEVSKLEVSEKAGHIKVVVKLLEGNVNNAAVTLSTIEINAKGGKHFEVVKDMRIDFRLNATERVVMINIFDNNVYEGDKLFAVQLSLVSGARIRVSPSTVTVRIIEDDQQPRMYCHFTPFCDGTSFLVMSIQGCCSDLMGSSVSISGYGGICQKCISVGFPSSSYTFNESKQEMHILPILVYGGALPVDIVIDVEAEEGTAVSKDFELLNTHQDTLKTRVMLTRNNAQSNVVLKIPPDGLPLDSRDNQSEVFGLRLKDILRLIPPNVIFNNSVVQILDVVPKIFMRSNVYKVSENIGAVNIDISTNGQHLSPISFAVLFTNESAQDGLDYLFGKSQYSIEPQQRSINITIKIMEDNYLEGTEYFNIRLQNINGAVPEPKILYAQVQIIDDDNITIGFEQTTYSVREDDGSIEVCTIIRTGNLQTSVTVTMATVDGTAVAPDDYSTLSQSIYFYPGSLKQCVAVSIIDDAIVEDVEQFSLTLTTTDNRVILQPMTAAVRIQRLDSAPGITIGFEQTLYTVREDIGSLEVCTAIRNGTLQSSVVVTLTTVDGTAVAPNDYSRLNLNVTFHPNLLSLCVAVQIIDDATLEGAEQFSFTLATTDNRVILEPRTATVLIGDSAPAVTIGFEQTIYSVEEDGGSIEVCAAIRNGTLQTSVEAVMMATVDGTAIAPGDYSSLSIGLTFHPDVLRQCVSVLIVDDTTEEDVEQFNLNLITTDNRVILEPKTAIVLIEDTPMDITIGFEQTVYSVREDIGSVEVCAVNKSMGLLPSTLVVQVSTEDGSAKASDDYSSKREDISIQPGFMRACVSVNIINDSVGERVEHLILILRSEESGLTLNPNTTTVFIHDDDIPAQLQFLNLGVTPDVKRVFLPAMDEGVSKAISPPEGFKMFDKHASTFYVNANGIILINSSSGVSSPTPFSMLPQGSTPFIAPYWFDNDPSSHGNVSYEIHSKSSLLLTQVSEYISNRESTQFTGNWMVVAYWLDVPELFSESVRNTYQAVLVTDGVSSYALFIYKCGLLNTGTMGQSHIGYFINSTLFEYHPLSGSTNTSEIACINQRLTPWSTLLYTLKRASEFICYPQLGCQGTPISRVATPKDCCSNLNTFSYNDGSGCNVCERLLVGFAHTSYSVSENDNNVNVIIKIEQGAVRDGEIIRVLFFTQNGTARSGDDYVSTTQNIFLTSGHGTGSLVNVSIPILDDSIAESVIEFFWANIELLTSQQIVVVSTNRTAVLIQDNDRVVIGFDRTAYFVSESDGFVTVTIKIKDGTVGKGETIILRFVTQENSATDMIDYIGKSQDISFTSGESIGTKIDINITILQDVNATEGLEVFYGRLTVLTTHVITNVFPGEIEIYIMDDKINCVNLTDPANGQILQSGTTPNSTTTYTCNSGYRLVGDSFRTCQKSGEWSGTASTCEPINCAKLTNPANGQVMQSGTAPDSTATYTCSSGYRLVGDSFRTCQESGEWSGTAPTCEPINCAKLTNPANGQVMQSGSTPNSTATYICNSGYRLVGDSSRTCQENGEWSDTVPTCEPINCATLTDPTNGQVVQSGTTPDSTTTYTCSSGYRLVGDSFRTCQESGEWSGTAPTCEPINCAKLTNPANGQVMQSGSTPNSTATYICNSGYRLVGDSSRTCQENGEWSDTVPTCEPINCATLTDPTNGQVVQSGTTPDSTTTYTCSSGYRLVGDSFRTCQESGEWSGTAPTCEPINCAKLTNPANGQVMQSGSTPDSTATYICNSGYRLVGDSSRTCQENGEWSDTVPTCEPINCATLTDPTNGQVVQSGTTPDSTTTYTCSSGYRLVGDSFRTCQESGEWSGTAPTCEPINCAKLTNPANGQVMQSGSTPDSTATYICNSGYRLVGDSSRTCQENGEWSDTVPTCEPINCGNLTDPVNGQVVQSGTTPDSTTTYTCSSGYRLVGDSFRTCQESGEWSGTAPTCEPINCAKLTNPANGQVMQSGSTPDSTATYICNSGYRLVGDSSRTCQENGEWSDTVPTCEPINCGNLTDPANGQVVQSGTTPNSTTTYTCSSGYRLVGDSFRTCQKSGEWSGTAPTCEPINCAKLTNPANGQVMQSGSTPDSTATYICNSGYRLFGDSSRTCQENGQWSVTVPTCEPINCANLTDLENGQVVQSGTTPTSTTTYTCNFGYRLVGNNFRTCQESGEWSGTAPTCEPIICANLTDPTNGQVVQSESIPASTATYICNSGYRLVGGNSRTCQESGEWNGTAPTCEPINCANLTDPENGHVTQLGSISASTATYTCNSGYRLVGNSSRTCQESGKWSGIVPNCEPKSTAEIGFVETTYSVSENDSTLTVTVAILQGTVEDIVIVQFNTQNGTANDVSDYHATTQTITFTPGQSVGTQRNITISMIDNSVVEDTESFFGILYTTSQNVKLSNQTKIFILDNDSTATKKLPVRFLKLGTSAGIVPVFLARESNAVSGVIIPRGPFPIFNTQHQTFYVSVDGQIFINRTAVGGFPTQFSFLPASTPSFIASFWLTGDITVGRGNVSYEMHSTSTSLLRQVSDYVSRNQSVPFVGSWMMVAFWSEVPEKFVASRPGHSRQCVLITDGIRSYALFVYECNLLRSGSLAAIGYYISGSTTSLEHPASNTLGSVDVDCSPRANNILVYKLFF